MVDMLDFDFACVMNNDWCWSRKDEFDEEEEEIDVDNEAQQPQRLVA